MPDQAQANQPRPLPLWKKSLLAVFAFLIVTIAAGVLTPIGNQIYSSRCWYQSSSWAFGNCPTPTPVPTPTPTTGPTPSPAGAVTPVPSLDCRSTPPAVAVGPWTATSDTRINPSADAWVHAEFWLPNRELISGYDEVAVIFKPTLTTIVHGVEGTGWMYVRQCSYESIAANVEQHIVDSLNIRHKRLVLISPEQLCSIVLCT